MGRWLSLFSAVVSAGLAVFFLLNLFTGSHIQKTWVAAVFFVSAAILAGLSAMLLRGK